MQALQLFYNRIIYKPKLNVDYLIKNAFFKK